MSGLVSYPPNPSALLPVKSLDDLQTNYESTASPPGAAIIPAPSSSKIRAEWFSRSWTNIAAYDAEAAHAGRENDIVATLVDSPASTPRRASRRNGAEDFLFILQDLPQTKNAPNLCSPQLPVSSVSVGQERTRPPLSTLGRTASANPQPSSPNHGRQSFHVSRIASAGCVAHCQSIALPSDQHPSRPWLGQRTRSQGSSAAEPMSGARDPEADNDDYAVKAGQSSSGSRRETSAGGKRNRSSSRGNGRVEKRIEATLPQAEQSSNARSRKSSHMLGLFKENTTAPSVKRTEDKIKTDAGALTDRSVPTGQDAPTTALEQGQSHHPVDKKIYDEHVKPSNDPTLPLVGSPNDEDQAHRVRKDGNTQRWRPSISTGSDIVTAGENHLVRQEGGAGNVLATSVSDGTHGDQSGRNENEADSHVSPKPFHRIEVYQDGNTPVHESSGTNRHHANEVGPPNQRLAVSEKFDANVDGSETAGDDEEESDKEQISSALYYPHQAPSPDAQEDLNLSPEGNGEGGGNTDKSPLEPLPPAALSIDVQSEEVDIALQSNNKSRYLHGDWQKSWVPQAGPASNTAGETGDSSVSGSEYEDEDESSLSTNGEDSSHTDEPETTPTATPIPTNPFLLSREKKNRRPSSAPIRAVELKPYNHQVGGHSTVFRFSRRAVCKQLSNRENEFYEVIEREHPELLRFLPRYDFKSLTIYPLVRYRC